MTFDLGIIAGGGNLPTEIIKAHQAKGVKCYIAGLNGYAENEKFVNANYALFDIGRVGAILQFFKNNSVDKIIFAGRVNRPNLSALKVDFIGAALLARILKAKILGDDSLLQIITKFIEEKGYQVISAQEVLGNQSTSCSSLETKQQPGAKDLLDIEIGIKVCLALGELDVGQAVITQNSYVIGIEAAEGTDNLIRRGALLRQTNSGGVLVKMMKSAQDQRLDAPTIGPETIKLLAQNNYHGLAIEKDKVIIVELQQTIKLANEHKIFIIEI